MLDTLLTLLKRAYQRVFASTPSSNANVPTTPAPGTRYTVAGWKLQIPGPRDVLALNGYRSQYFYLNPQQEMCFWVNCAERGTTANSNYVRSEMRHLAQWPVHAATLHQLSATLRVESKATPDTVTVMQVHSVSPQGENAPPLLRVYVKGTVLFAALKQDQKGADTTHTIIGIAPAGVMVPIAIMVQAGRLTIQIDGRERLAHDVGFWQNQCYFKAGCYPQANSGTATAIFSQLDVSV